MTRVAPRLVIIDDDPRLAEVVAQIARDAYPDARDLAIESLFTVDSAVLAIRSLDASDGVALIVISDLHLPPSDVDGFAILGEVKRRIPHAKRVLMTGRDPVEIERMLDQAQLDAFVSKPFSFDDMRALIGRIVESIARPPQATS